MPIAQDAEVGTLVLAGLIAGIICGLVPLTYGLMRDRRQLALIGFGASALAGSVLGLILAVPVAGVFVYLIYRSTRHGGRATVERDAA